MAVMKEPKSPSTTTHTMSGPVTCSPTANGWQVAYPVTDKERTVRKRKRFPTRQLAHEFAAERVREIKEHGICLPSPPREVRTAYEQYLELRALFEAKGQTLPPFDLLVSQALEAARENLLPGESSVAECVERYLAARKPDLSDKAYHSIRLRLRDFARIHGTQSIHAITPQTIQGWLDGLTRKYKGPHGLKAGETKASPDSRNHYRAALITFFGFAYEHGWTSTNPAACVRRAIPDRPDLAILTPQQAENLLQTAAEIDPAVLPALALQMFAGLRIMEIPDIRLDDLLAANSDAIQVPALKDPSHVVPACDALRAWLQHTPAPGAHAWTDSVSELRQRLANVFRAAGYHISIDSPRYSYYRYQFELTKDIDQIATQTCVPLLNYDVQPGSAEAYFSLTPYASGECPAGPTSPTSAIE